MINTCYSWQNKFFNLNVTYMLKRKSKRGNFDIRILSITDWKAQCSKLHKAILIPSGEGQEIFEVSGKLIYLQNRDTGEIMAIELFRNEMTIGQAILVALTGHDKVNLSNCRFYKAAVYVKSEGMLYLYKFKPEEYIEWAEEEFSLEPVVQ